MLAESDAPVAHDDNDDDDALPLPPYDPDVVEVDIATAKDFRRRVWLDNYKRVSSAIGGAVSESSSSAQEPLLAITPAMLALTTTRARSAFPTRCGVPAAAMASQGGSEKATGQHGGAAVLRRVIVQDIDCLDAAVELLDSGRHERVLVMDAGSKGHFGGGYQHGSRAQEEELCRRTTLPFQVDASLGWQTHNFYPLPYGDCVHVPEVVVFRHGTQQHVDAVKRGVLQQCDEAPSTSRHAAAAASADVLDDAAVPPYAPGYSMMSRPRRIGVGIVAAHRCPPVKDQRIQGEAATDTKEMLRSFLLTAVRNAYTGVVAVAVGCGAFKNPARHVAAMFAEAVEEAFGSLASTQSLEVVFAVFDDHNANHAANPDGNFAPFARAMMQHHGARVLSRRGDDITFKMLLRCDSDVASPHPLVGNRTDNVPPPQHESRRRHRDDGKGSGGGRRRKPIDVDD